MSASRYPDNSRYARERSPYRDRRQSTYSSGYPPRANDSNPRPNAESGGFPPRDIPRDVPRGPKILGDPLRGPPAAVPSGVPSAPRDGRGRGYPGRGEATPLREAPPLSSAAHPNSHSSWRADRDRDRDFERDRRERRPSPLPRRSPVRDVRDSRDQRDFPPRDLDINRARRNSRDGPPSAGSAYSDPPLVTGSSYRGSGIVRGRGGRDFHGDSRGRGRNFHNDDRDRHHDPRDRIPDRIPDRIQDRSYRPRSRSREPVRRDRDPRDERDFERRDRDERRFVPREYDSYIGPAGPSKAGPRGLDTHRGSVVLDSRHLPGTPTGAAPHSTHHSPADRLGPALDAYSRRSSVAADVAKDGRREPGGNDLLLAGRAEASRERYAPRASSPPAAVPAFGFSSNVWRNPALDAKSTIAAQPPKPAATALPPVSPAAVLPAAPAPPALAAPTAPKPNIPAGLSTAPPTGPKADRASEHITGDVPLSAHIQENRPVPVNPTRIEPRPPVAPASHANNTPTSQNTEQKPVASLPSATPTLANSPPQGPAARPRAPPTGPQAALRANVSPSFPRPAHLPFAPRDVPRDASPGAIAPPMGSRNGSGSGSALSTITSPQSLPANIPTGPKADRGNTMAARPSMYPPPDRTGFQPPRMPMGPTQKSMQWVRPGLNLNNRTTVPTKREFPAEDRDRAFGPAPKAPKFETSASVVDSQRMEHAKLPSPSTSRPNLDNEHSRDRVPSVDTRKEASPKPDPARTRRLTDVTMAEPSSHSVKPPMSATSAPEGLDDSDEDLDLDDADFAESEAKYNREKALLESKRIDLSAPNLRATTPLQEIMLLASLTIEHLPCQESKSVEEEMAPMAPIQPQPESITTELPTPKAEETEDMDLDEKDEKRLAPATRALRLRRGISDEHEENPDLSSLPYLGSAPLTPISELEGPRVSESIMLAIRDRLRKTIEPESDPEGTLEDFARAYRRWRIYIRSLDDTKDVVEQERQPSAEPLKATTPDVQSSAMGPLLDLPPPTTSRRGHSHRWATEYDLEAVIKESLKTAEEESKGKKETEPRRAMADPEKEAEVPPELTAYEAQRRRFIDTNFQREPGQGIFAFHYEPPEDDFTEGEHKIMVQHYRDQHAKKWGKLAEALYKEAGTSRTYKDCINHYYATKWGREYKGKVKGRRGGPRRRGGGAGRGRGAIANMERPDVPGEDGLPPALTETGRPRRSAAPTFGPGAETDLDTTTSTPTPGRMRRGTDADGNPEKAGRRSKIPKERGGRKAKAQPLAAAPIDSPVKHDRKALGVKMEDEAGKRPLQEMPYPMHQGIPEDQLAIAGEPQFHSGLSAGLMNSARLPPSARPGPSSYWSVTEQTDFQRNVAYFGTDWAAIATHMGTKTQTMVKNQYLRLVESGQAPELERVAIEADQKRNRGEDPGPAPTPTPAPKRRYESTQVTVPRTLAPTPEASLAHPVALPKPSSPNVPPSSRFSTIAQAPQQSKPLVSTAGYAMPDSALASVPSAPQQQSPQGHPPRGQSQHHNQHHLSRPELHHRGEPPLSGYFSQDDFPARREHRAPSQSSIVPQASRPLQPQVQPQMRAHEQPDPLVFRPTGLQERDTVSRVEPHQEHDAHLRYQAQHSRRTSGELHGRHFPSAAAAMSHMRPPLGAGSPENRPHSLQHRQLQQTQRSVQTPPDASTQPSTMSTAQQLPPGSTIATSPVKDEARHYPHPHQQPQQPPQLSTQSQAYPPASKSSMQVAPTAPTPPPSKPAPEPRKSNLLSLLNDTEPEQPRRRKPAEQNIPSHTPTPQQQTPIAPPPPVPQGLPARRDPYDAAPSQAPYGRPSYASQTALPQISSNRQVVDLTNDQAAGGRGPPREGWQRQPYPGQNQPQPGPAHNSPHPGLAQPAFGDARLFGNHRAVFAQHNGPRHNPSPPPLSAFSNSPHLHSRTPSLSGAAGQQPRHSMSSSAAGQHSQPLNGSSQILQPNPYAQVDPPGSGSQPSGPVGMRPSPHLHTSHIGPQREAQGRNEQSQVQNEGLVYSNPQTPNEHPPASQHMRGHSIQEQYRGRDPRDTVRHDFDARNTERDMSREVSHRANTLLREQRDSVLSRSTGPPQSHQDVRYQPPPQDRGFPNQRSHTPLSRGDHGPPPLQHPPHSSLGENHPLFGGQRQEDQPHRFRDPFPRDSRTEHMREEQVQQQQHQQHQQQRQQQQIHAAMSREEFMGREREMRDREMRDREMRERDAQYRESLMRRGQPGPPPQGQQPEQRGGANMPPDWANAVRQQDRWQR